jgi:hypothetical protein
VTTKKHYVKKELEGRRNEKWAAVKKRAGKKEISIRSIITTNNYFLFP